MSLLFPSTKPLLHVVNFGQTKQVPREDVYSIMVWTPGWASCPQKIPELVPDEGNLVALQTNRLSIEKYMEMYEATLREKLDDLTPTSLFDNFGNLIPDGAYLCCACSKEKASQRKCHRVVAAYMLKEAGWLVTLDGKVV